MKKKQPAKSTTDVLLDQDDIETLELPSVGNIKDIPDGDVRCHRMGDDSLAGDGIYKGDILVFSEAFNESEIVDGTICAIYLCATEELLTYHLYRNDERITLRVSNRTYNDLCCRPVDIEIFAVLVGVYRDYVAPQVESAAPAANGKVIPFRTGK